MVFCIVRPKNKSLDWVIICLELILFQEIVIKSHHVQKLCAQTGYKRTHARAHTHKKKPTLVIHLNRRPDVGVDCVEILVHSVQQPQQKLLSVVLSVPFKLHGVFWHDTLQRNQRVTMLTKPEHLCIYKNPHSGTQLTTVSTITSQYLFLWVTLRGSRICN